jgi:uncharacterized protein (TIGR02246 family)
MRSLLVAATILFVTMPAFAQDKSGTEAKLHVEKLLLPYKEAFKKKDADALSKMFAVDGILVTITGQEIDGRAQIEQAFTGAFKQLGDITTYDETVDRARPMGDGIWAIGHAAISGTTGSINNHWVKVYVPENGDLKIGLLHLGVNVPPPASQAKQ